MKVGILTYHSVCNFGANLQALSTFSYFKNRGYVVKIINWYPENLENYYLNKIPKEQQYAHKQFIEKNLILTDLCRTTDELNNVLIKEDFDGIVIGSDAVFSYIPFLKRIHPSRKTLIGITKVSDDHKFPNPFWGDFKSKAKIFSLSASAQYLDIDKCLPWTKRSIKKALERFTYLSVRDRWTKNIFEKLLGKTIEITPDPVFGFNDNVKIDNLTVSTVLNKYSLNSNYVVISFCNHIYHQTWYNELYSLLKKNNFTVVNLSMPEGLVEVKSDINIKVPIDPIDWYIIIMKSKGYIGQRMHPMIVALSNIVPFFVFDHYAYKKGNKRNDSSKIYDILERANLLECYHDIYSKNIDTSIVVERIMSFNKQKVEKFVEEYRLKYHKMMVKITENI